MDLQELKRKVSEGEGLHLEFKKKISHPEKVVRELVAFANTKGGLLLVGVEDDGGLSGLRFIEEEIFALEKAIESLIVPKIRFQKSILTLSPKKSIAIFQIFESERKPHYVRDADGTGKAFVRVKDRSIQASREMREIIRRQRNNKDVWFNYGEKEQVLMAYLAQNPYIRLKEFAKIASIKKFVASNTLIRLVLANVLAVEAREDGDRFYRI